MNSFIKPDIANSYDAYYQTAFGSKVDEIEKSIVSLLLKDVPREPMLELGCGTGHWSMYFIRQGFKLTGMDISDAMLKVAESKNLDADFIKADSLNIPFTDASFSVVSSVTMLEFVEDQEKVLQEIYRVLKPGGWLLLGCLNASSVLGKNKEQDEVYKHGKFLTPEEFSEKLQLFGSPELCYDVYLSSDFSILDGTPEQELAQPVFMAALVQKTR